MGRGWFESEEDYQGRVSREANERRIEDATGETPSQGWFESDESYRSRIADEANKATINNITGDSPSQGWFESDSNFRERIASESNKAIVEDATGGSPKQGWFESDSDYQSRIRHEANQATFQRETGEKPSQGWFESDSDFRARVSLTARENVAGRPTGRRGSYPSASASDNEHANAPSGQGGSSIFGVLLVIAMVAGAAALVPSRGGNESTNAGEPQPSGAAKVSEKLPTNWVNKFREKIAHRGALSVKYDEGGFENLEGEVEVYSDLPAYLQSILIKSQGSYELFSEYGRCNSAIGPLNESDMLEIFQGKIGLLKTPSNNSVNQFYFSGHDKSNSGKVCYFGSLTCAGVYACLDTPTRIYLGGVNSESYDEIVSLARPLPEYFMFDDFEFSLKSCDKPRSTYRKSEIRLSQELSAAITSDQSIASDILNIVLTRTANLCPIKEKRPLLPTTHPLSNIEVVAFDPTGNKMFEVRTDQNGSW